MFFFVVVAFCCLKKEYSCFGQEKSVVDISYNNVVCLNACMAQDLFRSRYDGEQYIFMLKIGFLLPAVHCVFANQFQPHIQSHLSSEHLFI